MCGIAGFCNPEENYAVCGSRWRNVLNDMNLVQKHRGPDSEGIYLKNICGLAHVRLSIIDIAGGGQPMTRTRNGMSCAICYNGEIYNMHELKHDLINSGEYFDTSSDTEVIIAGYMREGIDFVKKLNGIFAFALWDESEQRLYICRDQIGIKPLFFALFGNTLIFGSEPKSLFCYPDFKAETDKNSLREIFGVGPARTQGNGVFKHVHELKAGHYIMYGKCGLKDICYWNLESRPHTSGFEETIETTSELLYSAVKMQMLSDIPISTFLSGGIDSSLVTAICSQELKKQGKILNTFSFDFEGNDTYFKSNSFQPSRDRPFVDMMVEFSGTNHRYLECDNAKLADYLYKAVDARDLPCMADVESSLLYFCEKVVPYNKVTLTGECADEIFGGYPWFHKSEAFENHGFPWTPDMTPRKELLKPEVAAELNLDEYAAEAYENSIAEVPHLDGENSEEQRRREISYLNLKWFMMTLVDRLDRTSMFTGLEARVPFADRRIVDYVWNVPWEMKCPKSPDYPNGLVKGLLRKASEKYLPQEVLYRRKSPYPKTYNPNYENEVRTRLKEVINDVSSPVRAIIDVKKVEEFMSKPSDYGKPWYGQLMAGPQMIAYLLQVNYWLSKYNLKL
ncbi:MAG: asparagine synthase (glutamine-hydrolyzing) [Clostridiales bacterium]|jgi:asparagine synthase (glutamine-hydrolysing)|nr:asparagine synthase (glutamine-hydrolyzing) [Clostridiales bacterium]